MLAEIALCLGLATTPPIVQSQTVFNAVCVERWKVIGNPFKRPMACTDGRVIILPMWGASDFIIAHEMAHIAGHESEEAADVAAEECLRRVIIQPANTS